MSLIRTIAEDEEVPLLDEEEEEEGEDGKTTKKRDLNALDLDIDALTTTEPAHPWDFTWAKKAALKSKEGITTVDAKIQSKLAKKSAQWKRMARDFNNLHSQEGQTKEKPQNGKEMEGDEESSDGEQVDGKDSSSDGGERAEIDEEENGGEGKSRNEGKASDSEGRKERNGNEEDGEYEENKEQVEEDASESDEEAEDGDAEEGQDEKEEDESEEEEREDRIREILKTGNKKKKAFFQRAETEGYLAASFTDLHLSRPLLKALNGLGYSVPSPIQSQTIPIAMQGKDVCASASTGSGKTAAFVLPVLERLLHRDKHMPAVRVLILTPTRELAVQCHSVIEKLSKFTDVRACLVMGGLSNEQQEAALRRLPDIVVATPGRMIDHLHNAQSFSLENVDILILDEADRLLDMGFTAAVEEIIKFCPKGRQTMLFSATMTEEVDRLATLSLNNPVRVSVDPKLQVATGITQEFIRVKPTKEDCREAMLLALCTRTFKTRTVIFFRSKQSAHRMKIIFGLAGLKAAELHGNLPQAQRLEALEDFRDGKFDFLLATDLVARGLDIRGIEVIINYVMPANIEQYIHRVGRTARWGTKGKSVSFVGERDRPLLKEIVRNSRDKVKSRMIPPEVVEQFKARIDDTEHDIKEIIQLEQTERQNRLAERAVDRAKNLIEHHDKIHGRPKRTWFQSQPEKRRISELSGIEYFGDEHEEGKKAEKSTKKHEMKMLRAARRDEFAGLSRKKKRTKMARKEMEEDLAPQQARKLHAAAKSAKKDYRAKRQGFLPMKNREDKKDKDRTPKKPNKQPAGGTFATEAKKPSLKRKREEKESVTEKKKPFRKKGKAQFKSKKKFKRR